MPIEFTHQFFEGLTIKEIVTRIGLFYYQITVNFHFDETVDLLTPRYLFSRTLEEEYPRIDKKTWDFLNGLR